MKNLSYIIVAFIGFIYLTSCEDDLDQVPLSSGTTENFYSTENDFIQARNGTYSAAFHGGGTYGYANRILNLSETRSDNLYATTQASRAWEGINNFFVSIVSSGLIEEAYNANFNAIYKANQLIAELEANGEGIIVDPEMRNNMHAEARFLRAFCYFDLVRYFGKVPVTTETLTPQEASTVARSPVSDVYDLILSDLMFAIDNLPGSYPDAEYGRVTSFGAKALLGLVYLTRSSPSYGIEGPGMDSGEWDLAYQQFNDIVNSGNYAMEENYEDIFTVEGTQNSENVLVIPYTQGTGNGLGGNFMAEVTSDPYFHSLGLSDQGALEDRPVSVEFRNSFADQDERLEFGIVDTFSVVGGRYDGFWNQTVMTKWADESRYGDGRTDWGVDFIVIRYTDVLMMKAEATLRGAGGSQADVDAVVNAVRERAGLAQNASNVTLEELFAERRKEFFAEGSRWFDLFRSGNAVQIMNDWKAEVDEAGAIREINENYLIYPFPLQEILSTPGLYEQNPGY